MHKKFSETNETLRMIDESEEGPIVNVNISGKKLPKKTVKTKVAGKPMKSPIKVPVRKDMLK